MSGGSTTPNCPQAAWQCVTLPTAPCPQQQCSRAHTVQCGAEHQAVRHHTEGTGGAARHAGCSGQMRPCVTARRRRQGSVGQVRECTGPAMPQHTYTQRAHNTHSPARLPLPVGRHPGLLPFGNSAFGTTQHNTTQHNTTQHNTIQHNTTQHNTAQHNTAQHSTTQHNTSPSPHTHRGTVGHSTARHITARRNTAQHGPWTTLPTTIGGSEAVQRPPPKGERAPGPSPPKNIRNAKEGGGQRGRKGDPHWGTSARARPPDHKQGAGIKCHPNSPLIGNGAGAGCREPKRERGGSTAVATSHGSAATELLRGAAPP